MIIYNQTFRMYLKLNLEENMLEVFIIREESENNGPPRSKSFKNKNLREIRKNTLIKIIAERKELLLVISLLTCRFRSPSRFALIAPDFLICLTFYLTFVKYCNSYLLPPKCSSFIIVPFHRAWSPYFFT